MSKKLCPKPPAGRAPRQAAVLNRILNDLASADDTTRAMAVRDLCPCRTAWDVPVQRYVCAMQDDPSPSVRHEVSHVLFEDGRWGKRLQQRHVIDDIQAGEQPDQEPNRHSLAWRAQTSPCSRRVRPRRLNLAACWLTEK